MEWEIRFLDKWRHLREGEVPVNEKTECPLWLDREEQTKIPTKANLTERITATFAILIKIYHIYGITGWIRCVFICLSN